MSDAMIHPSAIIEDGAQIDPTARIGPFCVIGSKVVIGPAVELKSHVVVSGNTTIWRTDGGVFVLRSLAKCPKISSSRVKPAALKLARATGFVNM